MKSMLHIAVVLLIPFGASAQQLPMILDLSGKWKFDVGDDANRAAVTYDDTKWDVVHVPSPWEDQGFPGYDGYAWYRKHFEAENDWPGRSLYLTLGEVDDVDEVYINGRLMGFTGGFPPHYMTAYDVVRVYRIPPEFLNPGGDNVVAVRVYDSELSGGILRGRVGILEDTDVLRPDVPVTTGWKFTTGDNADYRTPGFNDGQWRSMVVPLYWEMQGFREYDGYGWYRVRFTVPDGLLDQRLILLAGKIDDYDETFLNGQRIGRTGDIDRPFRGVAPADYYLQLRAYTIPPDLIRRGGENVLAIRVFDGFMHGGIYDGPVGLVTRDHYMKWESRHSGKKNAVQRFFDWLVR